MTLGFWPRFWTSAGFLGFVPKAPGTCGTLLGVFLAMGCARYSEVPRIQALAMGSLLLLFCGVTLLYAEAAEKALGMKDPPQVVSDEVAGFLLAVLGLPILQPGMEWVKMGGAFLLFRVLDILKPPPIRRLQRLPGGLGILAADLAAGALTNLILRLLLTRFAAYPGL